MTSTDTLHILWLNDNPVTAKHMVFMYATDCLLKGWWKKVHLIVWGATAKLLCENAEMQELVKAFQAAGGRVSACKRCAEQLGVLNKMENLEGIEMLYIGQDFSKFLKSSEKVITL